LQNNLVGCAALSVGQKSQQEDDREELERPRWHKFDSTSNANCHQN
jgi:hypothetical protein